MSSLLFSGPAGELKPGLGEPEAGPPVRLSRARVRVRALGTRAQVGPSLPGARSGRYPNKPASPDRWLGPYVRRQGIGLDRSDSLPSPNLCPSTSELAQ